MAIIETQHTEDGSEQTIYIEVDTVSPKGSTFWDKKDLRAAGKVLPAVRDAFGDAAELARSCATVLWHKVKSIEETVRPNEFAVEFGVKIDAEVGAIISKAGAEAHLVVKLKWMKPAAVQTPPHPPAGT